jgi:L-lysine 2,3-aminomutase
MIKIEDSPKFAKALNKALGKFRINPKYSLQYKMQRMSLTDLTTLNDYLSIASEQDLKSLSNAKPIADVVEHFKIHLIKALVLESALQKRAIEQNKKSIQLQKERQIKYAKEQEERLKKQQEAQKLLAVQIPPNFFTQLNLTTEQKAILKKMVDGQ